MSDDLPKPGALVEGRYRIVDRIGEGGHGVVYRARRAKRDRPTALKLIPHEEVSDRDLERLRREVFHASGLTNENTVTVYDYGTTADGHLYIAMEYLPGLNLGEWLHEYGALDVDQTTDALFKILDSLAEAHRNGIVHRDLKPGNIIVQRLAGPTDRLEVKILDFGLSKYVGDSEGSMPGLRVTQEGRVYGTPQYMAPEQAVGENATPATDIYTVGLLGYEMVTGEPAFAGDSRQSVMQRQIREPLPALPDSVAGTPLEAFVRRCTQKSPSDRFENAGLARKWLVSRQREYRKLDRMAGERGPPESREGPSDSTSSDHQAATPTPPAGFEHQLSPSDISRRIANLPLLGRDRELQTMLDWARAVPEDGGLLWLTGTPGVGKTRLLDELESHHTDQELLVFRDRFRRSGSPLETVRDLLIPIVGSPERAPRPRVPDVLDDGTVERARRDLGLLDDPAEGLRRTHAGPMFQGILGALRDIAAERPICLCLDDFHHASGMAVGLVRRLARDLLDDSDVPVGMFLVGRSQELRADASIAELLPDAGGSDGIGELLELDPLDEASARQFLDQVLPLSPTLRGALVRQASGNPLYLAQIVRYLVERELVTLGNDRRYELRDRDFDLEELIPPSLVGLSRRRLRSLANRTDTDGTPLRTLVRMAVLGDRFETSLLERMLEAESSDQSIDLETTVAALERLDIIRETTVSGEPGLAFSDAMFRRAVLETLEVDDDELARLHRLAGRTKVRHLGAASNRSLSDRGHEIGRHLERAGEDDRAVDWYLRAASRFEELGDYSSALEDLRASERLLTRQRPGSTQELRRVVDLRLDIARLSRKSGKFGPAEDTLRAGLEEAKALDDTRLEAELSHRLAEVLLHRAAYDASRRYFDEAERLYRESGAEPEAIRAALGRTRIYRLRGDNNEARDRYSELLDRADSIDDDELRARAELGLAWTAYESGDLAGAASKFDPILERVAPDSKLRADTDLAAALVELYLKGPEHTLERIQTALKIGRDRGELLVRARAHLTAGMALRRTLQLRRASRHADRSRELYERAAHRWGLGKALLLEGELRWIQGEPERGADLAEDASQLHEDLDDVHGLALSLAYGGLFLNSAGRSEEARERLLRAMTIGSRSKLEVYRPRTLLFLGMVEEAEHDIDTASTYFADAAASARNQENFEIEMIAELSLAKLRIVDGDIERAADTIVEYRREADARGHVYGVLLGRVGEAWIALHRGREVQFEEAMSDVRDYRSGEHAPDFQLEQRLFRLAQLLARRNSTSETTAELEDVEQLLRSLGADGYAHRLALQLRTISESELTSSVDAADDS